MFRLVSMPAITECSIVECAYNTSHACHAIAITVGDGDLPMCDTFFVAREHSADHGHAGVGACKVTSCAHNQELECRASRILVGRMEHRVRCMTYVEAPQATHF